MGHLLREAGYYTAYKGKWHLTKEFETVNKLDAPEKFFTKEMEAYGFADYIGVGDIIAHTEGGYRHDGIITETAVSWLRSKTGDLAKQGKPWFLAVNLVNPHDIMFYNTDQPGSRSRKWATWPTLITTRRTRSTPKNGDQVAGQLSPAYRCARPATGPHRLQPGQRCDDRAVFRTTRSGAGTSATTIT